MIIKAVKYSLSLLLFLAFVFSANAYYNPGSPTGFVNDYAGVLKVEQKQSLESKLSQFEKDSSNEISVVMIPSLQDDTIENFAVELFKDWGIGKTGKDNGILVLIALQDRKMRIEVGYGLEGALADAQSNWIINNIMKPTFQGNDFYKGIDEAINKIISATKGEYVPSDNKTNNDDIFEYLLIGVFALLYLLRFLAGVLGRSKTYWAGGLLGVLVGGAVGFFFKSVNIGLLFAGALGVFGLAFDYIVSRVIKPDKRRGWGWFGGGRGGGGFGGFGGGGSGGGGSSGSW